MATGTGAQRPFWTPVGRALRSFGGNLAEGIAYAITALPYLLPWLFMVAFMFAFAVWAVRRCLRWWRGSRRGKAVPSAPHVRDGA